MTINRTGNTERDIEHVVSALDHRQGIAVRNKRKRYRRSKLDPYRADILALHARGQSLSRIQLALSCGLLGKKIRVGKTTLHDYLHPNRPSAFYVRRRGCQ